MSTATLTPYQELLVEATPRVIRSDAEYRRALRQIERLIKPHPRRAESQLVELLATLIEDYETASHPTPKLPPRKRLAELIEAREITQAQLAAATGISRQTISNVLADRRGISKSAAVKLAEFFRVPVGDFVKPAS